MFTFRQKACTKVIVTDCGLRFEYRGWKYCDQTKVMMHWLTCALVSGIPICVKGSFLMSDIVVTAHNIHFHWGWESKSASKCHHNRPMW